MVTREVTVINAVGLHSRPATFFIREANKYRSSIWIEKGDRRVNAKSLLGVLSMGVAQGMSVTIIAEGQDENAAIEGLASYIATGLGE